MHLTISRELLAHHLSLVSRVVTTRTSLPILTNILLETDGNYLRLTTTDLEISVSTRATAEIIQEGSYTVPARLFQEVVSGGGSEEITVKVVGKELIISTTTGTTALPGIDAAEYPALPEIKVKTTTTLQAQAVVSALKKVMIAAAQDQGRPILTGVLVSVSSGKLVFAATDSFRLSEYTLEVPENTPELSCVIPTRAIQELVRSASQVTTESITISLGEGQILFDLQTLEITSRLLTGNFPNYNTIIPTAFVQEIQVKKEEVIAALRLINAFSNQGVSTTKFEFPQDILENVILSSHKSQKGRSVQKLAGERLGEKELTAALNTRFLLEALGVCEGERVWLRCSGVTSPLLITGSENHHVQLVMPIRLDA